MHFPTQYTGHPNKEISVYWSNDEFYLAQRSDWVIDFYQRWFFKCFVEIAFCKTRWLTHCLLAKNIVWKHRLYFILIPWTTDHGLIQTIPYLGRPVFAVLTSHSAVSDLAMVWVQIKGQLYHHVTEFNHTISKKW